MGGGDHQVPRGLKEVIGKQISYMTLIGVHLFMQLMHPNGHVTIMCVCVSLSDTVYEGTYMYMYMSKNNSLRYTRYTSYQP